MTLTPSIALLFVLVVASALATQISSTTTDAPVVVHEGRCPSNNLLIHIHCRRRVCLPEEMISRCQSDANCPTTHKCCRPMCSCRDECVRALPEFIQN